MSLHQIHKKIAEYYVKKSLLEKNTDYGELKKMVGKNIYELNKENI